MENGAIAGTGQVKHEYPKSLNQGLTAWSWRRFMIFRILSLIN